MGETKIRYDRIRVADETSDQKSALEILAAPSTATTQEQLQEFVLSQLKRLIYGNLTGHWYDDFVTEGVHSLIGLTSVFEFDANCQATDVVGDVVYVTGDEVLGKAQVSRVDITNYTKMPGIGVVLSKSGSTDCRILRYGVLDVTGLTPGKIYFVGVSGRPVLTRPVAGASPLFIQVLGVAISAGKLLLNPSFNLTKILPA